MPDPVAIPPTTVRRFRIGSCLDAFAVALVLAFAFLAASFVARNSDLWLHLATGRLVAHGEFTFGQDPFAESTEGKYWANHSWLFDYGLFLAMGWFGGTGLVVLKAIGATAIAGGMLYTGRGRGPTGFVALSILAMSPRLLLQPTMASFLLFAICIVCLRAGGRAFLLVPAAIALWVNLDAWFVLGPVLVGIFWLGHRLDPKRGTTPWPRWLFPAAVLACLISPHHVRALQLPLELSPAVWNSDFATDPRFAAVFASPWRWAFLSSGSGANLAGWAFFILLASSAISFLANRTARRDWRILLWLPFALLASWQIRLVPFFAIVAGPIAALNFAELSTPTRYVRFGRGFVLSVLAILLAAGWFGWLPGTSIFDSSSPGSLYTDPTLRETARQFVEMRKSGRLKSDEPVFVTHPDLAHYLAWHAPGERYLLDSRLQLFTDVAPRYSALSQAIGIVPRSSTATELKLPTTVAYYDPDPARFSRGLAEIAVKTGDWQIAKVTGTAVFLVPKGSPTSPTFQPEREAFAPVPEREQAKDGPAVWAEPLPWWSAPDVRSRSRKGTWEADAATTYLRLFENAKTDSVALPLLACSSVSLGIEADSHDAVAWRTLGRAYLSLNERTGEREALGSFTILSHIRDLQIVAAFSQAVLIHPDSAVDRETLARILLPRNRLDLALRHAKVAVELVRKSSRGSESQAAFDERLARVTKLAEQLQELVSDAENRYFIRSIGRASEPVARARIAADLGLISQAIEVLLTSHSDLYGVAGLTMLADLLLQSGQVADCRVLLDRDELRRNPNSLGSIDLPRKLNADGSHWPYRFPAYDWLDLCQSAAAGRYRGANEILDRMAARLDAVERSVKPSLSLGVRSLTAREVGLSMPPSSILTRVALVSERVELQNMLAQTKAVSVTRADLGTLAGLLELERGDPTSAAARFANAVEVYRSAKPFGVALSGEAMAVRYHEVLSRPR